MRRPLVAGNWKMNLTQPEAAALIGALSQQMSIARAEVLICPSFTSLAKAAEALRTTQIVLGAQDVFWADKGAFTGKVSPNMLLDLGCKYCIVGHSETRGRFGKVEVPENTLGYFAETDATICLKIAALLMHGLKPILCVGETLAEREAGQTDAVIAKQLAGALAGFDSDELFDLAVAYEPVWAIGTGKTCDSTEANRVCGMIRNVLAANLSPEAADSIRILYGGSVKSSNASELFSQPEIDGGLVGGASLEAYEFARIVLSA